VLRKKSISTQKVQLSRVRLTKTVTFEPQLEGFVAHRSCRGPETRVLCRDSSLQEKRSRALIPALISAAPHYGLRYGFDSATGDFQRLRGRAPPVSSLRSCMGRSFTAVTRGRDFRGSKRRERQRAFATLCAPAVKASCPEHSPAVSKRQAF
jgi:hypothetical protein